MKCVECGIAIRVKAGKAYPKYLWETPKGQVGLCSPQCEQEYEAAAPAKATS
jgi:hypothetical protein